MADENIQEDHPEIAPKSAPKPEREPIWIEGQATDLTPPDAVPTQEVLSEVHAFEERSAESSFHEPTTETVAIEPASVEALEVEASEPVVDFAAEPAVAARAEAEPASPPPMPPPPPTLPPASGYGGVARTLGIVVLVAVAALLGAFLAPLLNGDKEAADAHFGAIDAALKDESAARKALEARVAKLEGTAVSAEALASVAADAKAAKLAADKAATLAPAATVASAPPAPPTIVSSAPPSPTAAAAPAPKVELAPTPVATPDPEIAKLATGASVLADRIAKLETALSAQKSEARADPLAKVKSLDPVAEAVAAISLAQRLAEGEPYAAEFAALTKAGADPAALSALKPYADAGAPTAGKLAATFAALTPKITAAKTEGKGEVVDEMMDKLRGLVKVHVVSEVAGDDPAALTSQISAALARGDVAAALATEGKLPEPARTAAAGWAKNAAGLENATAAARSLAETALKRFADVKS